MIDYAMHRAKFTARIEKKKQQAMQLSADAKAPTSCAHEWQKFKERILSDRRNRKEELRTNNLAAIPHGCYFVVSGCIKCHEKRRLKLVVAK